MASLLLVSPLSPGGVAAAQSQGQEMLICHRTGSPTNPWVFMSIDASTWPEHEAQGDIRANSLADCAPPAAAPVAPAGAAQAVAPAAPAGGPQAPAAVPAAAQAAVGVPPAEPANAQVASPAQPPAQVASPAQPPQVAGVQAAEAESAQPPVSSLPASGEPDRPFLVVGLLALLAVGLGLRRLGRSHA
jgi:hypothetical protein